MLKIQIFQINLKSKIFLSLFLIFVFLLAFFFNHLLQSLITDASIYHVKKKLVLIWSKNLSAEHLLILDISCTIIESDEFNKKTICTFVILILLKYRKLRRRC